MDAEEAESLAKKWSLDRLRAVGGSVDDVPTRGFDGLRDKIMVQRTHPTVVMTDADAWLYAECWASEEGPGECFKGFGDRYREVFNMRNAIHRVACLSWLEECISSVRMSPDDYATDEVGRLQALQMKVLGAPSCERHEAAWRRYRNAERWGSARDVIKAKAELRRLGLV